MKEAVQRKKFTQSIFPYKIGQVAQWVFPALFERKMLTKHDMSFLIAGRSGSFFATRSDLPILRQRITGEPEERLVGGRQRYYENCIVKFAGCEYYLTKEWWNDERHMRILLLWLLERGLDRNAVLALCNAKANGGVERRKQRDTAKQAKPTKGSVPASDEVKEPQTKRKVQHVAGVVNPSGSPRTKAQLKVPEGFSMCRHVKAFFIALEERGFVFAPREIEDLCSGEWTAKVFHVWLPAFVEWNKLIELSENKETLGTYRRYWKRAFTFGRETFGICAQWYAWQKDYFDEWASAIASRAGIDYEKIPVEATKVNHLVPTTKKRIPVVVEEHGGDVVTIDVSPLVRHTVSIKRK